MLLQLDRVVGLRWLGGLLPLDVDLRCAVARGVRHIVADGLLEALSRRLEVGLLLAVNDSPSGACSKPCRVKTWSRSLS